MIHLSGSVFELGDDSRIGEWEIGKDCFKGNKEKDDSVGFVMREWNDVVMREWNNLKGIDMGRGSFNHFNWFELSDE